MAHKRSLALLTLYSDMDAATAKLAAASGLTCGDSCGQCCESPNVRTTQAELAPLVDHLMATGRAEVAFDSARAAGPGPCVFYLATGPGQGRCGVYAWRPSICRLFGYAAVRGKSGQPELAACRVHQTTQPEAVARAHALIREGFDVALFVDYQERAGAAADAPVVALEPINVAVARALERALYRAELERAAAPAPAPCARSPRHAAAHSVHAAATASRRGPRLAALSAMRAARFAPSPRRGRRR